MRLIKELDIFMPIEILKASAKDALLLANMNHRLIRDEKHRNPMTVAQLSQRIRKWLRKDYKAFLFLKDEQVFGYCLFGKTKDFVYIRQFYIERNKRRLGLGKNALDLMKRKVWKNGVRLRLDVLVDNKRAIAFWKVIGFKDYCLTMEL